MKKALKIFSLVLVLVMVLAPVVSLADVPITNIDPDTPAVLEQNAGIISTAVGVLQFAGYGVAIVMVLWLGIQWMLAQPSKKAELKSKMWSMAIGIILLVGGVSIIRIVWEFASQSTENIN